MRAKVISKISAILLVLCLQLNGFSQAPQGFSYQAVIRNPDGQPIANQSVKIHILLTDQLGSTIHYGEEHTLTTSSLGVASLTIGEGDSKVGTLAAVPWQSGDVYIKVEVDPTGSSGYQSMGNPVKFYSVPYALYADNAKEVVSLPNATDDDPIFVVKNKVGQIVFAVYQSGVRVFVEDSPIIKGAKGGFAVAGLTSQAKGEPAEYMRITSDSARIYINEATTKGAKGGFAVGGLTSFGKSIISRDLMYVAPDSTRIWVKNQGKGAKGGFAVAGLTSKGKAATDQFLSLTPDNYFIGHNSGLLTTGLYNSFIGYQSGSNNSSGENNIFIGYQAGLNNTTSKNNVFIGNQSGFNNKGGWDNVFLGTQSGYSNLNGFYNVFLGYKAGYTTNSSFNTFLGYQAGLNNSTGQYNSFMGYNAGLSSTSGASNVILGFESGSGNTTGSWNVFIGHQAGYSNNTQNFNTMIGYQAGYSSYADGGTLLGYMTGKSITTGAFNTMIGSSTGTRTTTGERNIFIGSNAGDYNTTGSQNIFIGLAAGRNNVSGIFNVMVGTAAGESVSAGNSNVMIGHYAGQSATGSDNVFIGTQAGLNETGSGLLIIDNFENGAPLIWGDFSSSRVGIHRVATANALEVDGDASKTVAGNWSANSDKRIKTNIKDISNAYETILKLRPVTFNYTDEYKKKHSSIEGHLYYNFIAQEFQQVFPEAVKGSGEYLDGTKDEILQIDTYNAQVVSIKAVQELILENQKQQKEIEALKKELDAIKAMLKK